MYRIYLECRAMMPPEVYNVRARMGFRSRYYLRRTFIVKGKTLTAFMKIPSTEARYGISFYAELPSGFYSFGCAEGCVNFTIHPKNGLSYNTDQFSTKGVNIECLTPTPRAKAAKAGEASTPAPMICAP